MRDSINDKNIKGKGAGLVALFKKDDNFDDSNKLTFDEKHFQKFLKEDQQL